MRGRTILSFFLGEPKTSAEKETSHSDGGANAIKKEAQDPQSPEIPCETSLDQTDSSYTVQMQLLHGFKTLKDEDFVYCKCFFMYPNAEK